MASPPDPFTGPPDITSDVVFTLPTSEVTSRL